MRINFKQSWVLGALVVLVVSFAAACTHQKVVQVGSHKVTVSRHGFEKKLHLADKSGTPTFEYEGVSTAGHKLSVFIEGNKVRINGRESGMLREGDSVLIGDDGVAVNSLDYGESEKYLRENNSPSVASKMKE